MTDTQIRYIELFITALKTSSFYEDEFEHNSTIYIDYLSLHESLDNYTQKIRSELEFISQQVFRKKYSVDELTQSLERKVKLLNSACKKLKIEREGRIPATVVKEDAPLKKVFSFYCSKRAHKGGSDVILFKVSEGKALEVSNMLQVIGKDYLRLSLLEEVMIHLEFNDYYRLNDLQIVESSADACHMIRKQLNSNGQTITKEQLIDKVLNEFQIKRYTDKSAQEKKRLIKNTVGQWIRDNKIKCITN